MHILVISFTDLKNDRRVNRQIRFLASEHHVTAAGRASPEIPGVDFVPIGMRPKSLAGKALSLAQIVCRQYDAYYWRLHHVREAYDALSRVPFDLAVANDLETLPLALRLAGDRPVLFDSHEYFPRRFEDQIKFRWLINPYAANMCTRYAPQAAAMLVTSPGVGALYERDLGFRPILLTNATDYYDLSPIEKRHGDPIRLVHHGAASSSRRIELTIEMMDYLDDRFSLDLFLVPGDPRYIASLQRRAKDNPRIRFPDPVPGEQLVPATHNHDIGVFLLPPTSASYRYALPNKLFEYIQARLAIAIGPSDSMASLVREHGLGVISEDYTPQSLARLLLPLDHDQINAYKRRSHAIARRYSSEGNRQLLLDLVQELAASHPRA